MATQKCSIRIFLLPHLRPKKYSLTKLGCEVEVRNGSNTVLVKFVINRSLALNHSPHQPNRMKATGHSSATKRGQPWDYQSREGRAVAGGGVRAGREPTQPEVRARGGVLEAGEHPPVHDEEEGHEGAPGQQPARAPPPPPVLLQLPPPRPLQRARRRGARGRQQRQRRGRRLGHSGAGFGSRRAGRGSVGIEQSRRSVVAARRIPRSPRD